MTGNIFIRQLDEPECLELYMINTIRENWRSRFVVKVILKLADGSMNPAVVVPGFQKGCEGGGGNVPHRVEFLLNKT